MDQGRSVIKSIAIGVAVGIVSCAALCMLIAAAVSGEKVPREIGPIGGTCAMVLSVFIGSRVSAKKQGGKTLMTCFGTGGALLCIAVLMKAAFYQGWSQTAIPGLIAAVGAAVFAAILPMGRRKQKRKR